MSQEEVDDAKWITADDLQTQQDGGDLLSQPYSSQSSEEEDSDEEYNEAVAIPNHVQATTALQVPPPITTSTSVATAPTSSTTTTSADKKDYSHLVVFTAHKAGMGGKDSKVSQKEVNQKIHEISKHSKFFKNAKNRDLKLDKRILELKNKLNETKSTPVSEHLMERVVHQIEKKRRLDRWWVVVDLDMFFAAVAMRDDPSLVGKPVAVGGMGMLSTANYEARKYGVRSAMPGFIAKQICKDLLIVRSDFKAYTIAAQQTRDVFRQYDPYFDALSLDEASMDITDYLNRKRAEMSSNAGSISSSSSSSSSVLPSMADMANQVVEEMRAKCCSATNGLTCSAGIGPNKMLAKIASDFNKPNGQYYVGHDVTSIINFMRALPIRRVPGVGKVTERILSEVLGVKSCADMFDARHRVYSSQLFSPRTIDWLLSASLGISKSTRDDPTGKLNVGPKRKGISCEKTFASIKTLADMLSRLKRISNHLGRDMQKRELRAKTLTLKIKTDDFDQVTRAKTIPTYTSDATVIFEHIKVLMTKEFKKTVKGRSVRLLGIRASGFHGAAARLDKGQQQLETAFAAKEKEKKKEKGEEGETSLVGKKRAVRPALVWDELDANVLAQLPQDIQDELERHLYRPKKKIKKKTPSIQSFFGKK